MLLENIHKLTPDDHAEKEVLAHALETVSGVAMFVNMAKKEASHTQTTIKLADTLKGQYDSLIQSYRHFIAETKCKLRCPTRGVNRWASYKVYLFSDVLILLECVKLKTPKALLMFLHFASVGENGKVIQVDALSRGTALQVQMKISERVKWRELIQEQIKATLAAVRSKGYRDINVADLANRRIVEFATSSQLHEDFTSKKRRMAEAAQENMMVLMQIQKHEEDMVRIGETIDSLREKKARLRGALSTVESTKNQIRDRLIGAYERIEKTDRSFVAALNGQADAFKEVFDQDPITLDQIPQRLEPKYPFEGTSEDVV